MPALVVEIPPVAEPILLADAKNWCRVTVTQDDSTISELIQAAREHVENETSLSLVNNGYRHSLDAPPYFTDTVLSQRAYPPSYYALPQYSTTLWNYSQMIKGFVSPLVAVTAIDYLDYASQSWKTLLPTPFAWEANAVYTLGEQIGDGTPGNLQQVTGYGNTQNEDGTYSSGASTPVWSATLGGTTADGGLVWKNMGPAPKGDFLVDYDSQPPRIFPLLGSFWPAVLYEPNALVLHYVAGFGNTGDAVPATIRSCMKTYISFYYDNRGAVDPKAEQAMLMGIKRRLATFRALDFAPTNG